MAWSGQQHGSPTGHQLSFDIAALIAYYSPLMLQIEFMEKLISYR